MEYFSMHIHNTCTHTAMIHLHVKRKLYYDTQNLPRQKPMSQINNRL